MFALLSILITVSLAPVNGLFCKKTLTIQFLSECALCSFDVCPEGSQRIPHKPRVPCFIAEDHWIGCKVVCGRDVHTSECCTSYWGNNCDPCPGGALTPCFNHGVCSEGLVGSGICTCNDNFAGFACEKCADELHYGANCADVCMCEHGHCDAGISGNGSCTCDSGYRGRYCNETIESCESKQCHEHASCTEDDSGAICRCSYGYEGDGTVCKPVNRCLEVPPICHEAANCTTIGPALFECHCHDGYQGDGYMCVPIDPCQNADYGGCLMQTTLCRMTGPGKRACDCLDGYENFVEGVGCSLIDVCQQNKSACDPSANCTTVAPGEFQCICQEGYVQDVHRRKCYGNVLQRLKELNASDPQLKGQFIYAIRLMQLAYRNALTARGPFTVFVSTDAGYARFVGLNRVFEDRLAAQQLMRHHIIASHLSLEELTNATLFYTLDGHPAELSYKSGELTYKLRGKRRHSSVLKGDVVASNGFIHVVRGVLSNVARITHGEIKTMLDVISSRDEYSKFYELILAANMQHYLQDENIMTVFIPTNSAWDKLATGTTSYLQSSEGEIKLSVILKNHFVHGPVMKSFDLINMHRFVSIGDTATSVELTRLGQIRLNGIANISQTDVPASNGLIHSIDAVLVPEMVQPILPHRCDLVTYRNIWGTCAVCHGPMHCPIPSDTRLDYSIKSGCRYWVSIADRAIGSRYQRFIGCQPLCKRTISQDRCCPGFYGPNCMPCPGGFQNPCFGRGKCNDGIHGDGVCVCDAAYNGTSCEYCTAENMFGPKCDQPCTCLNGVCRSGVTANAHSGQCRAATCAHGFVGADCSIQAARCFGRLRCHAHAHCIRFQLPSAPMPRPFFRFPGWRRDSLVELSERLLALRSHWLRRGRCTCNEGYTGDGVRCIEVDPCKAANRGNCHLQAQCIKTGLGTRKCVCDDGWHGDGMYCQPIIVCTTHDQCHERAKCINIAPGKFECRCIRGFHGNGTHCVNEDICLEKRGGCHANATCTPTGPGTANCTCSDEMGGDGFSCYGSIAYEIFNIPHLAQVQQLFQRLPSHHNYLSDLTDSYTFFAPTDEAMAAFLKTASADFWKKEANLFVLFGYHTLQGDLSSDDLDSNSAGSTATALVDNEDFTVNISKRNSDIFVNDARIVKRDIPAVNGYIHLIDKVLEPYPVSEQQLGLEDLLDQHPEFSEFTRLLKEQGILHKISYHQAFTLFVPTNDQLAKLPANVTDRFLSYYVIPRKLKLAQLRAGLKAPTFLGETKQGHLEFSKVQQRTMVNNVSIVKPDLMSFAGVVHGISGVLLPVLHVCDKYTFNIHKSHCFACDKPQPCTGTMTPRVLLRLDACSSFHTSSYSDCVQICDERHLEKSCCKGYTGRDCHEICKVNNGGCHKLAICQVVEDRTVCTCPPGYHGNGYDHCFPRCNEMVCHPNATCIIDQKLKKAMCRCNEGFHGDGHKCTLNPVRCSENNGGCSPLATCTEIPTASSNVGFEINCSCKSSYVGNGTECYADILDTLSHHPQTTQFYKQLMADSQNRVLTQYLKNPAENMTLFVPIDGQLDSIQQMTSDDCLYHAVHTRVYLTKLLLANNTIEFTSLAGSTLRLSNAPQSGFLVDGVEIVRPNIVTMNGMVHLIAKPLVLPPGGQGLIHRIMGHTKLHVIIGVVSGLVIFTLLLLLVIKFRRQLATIPAKVRSKLSLRGEANYVQFDGDQVQFTDDAADETTVGRPLQVHTEDVRNSSYDRFNDSDQLL